MCVGVVGGELMIRVGKDLNDEALAQPYARPMNFTVKPMDGLYMSRAKGWHRTRALPNGSSVG